LIQSILSNNHSSTRVDDIRQRDVEHVRPFMRGGRLAAPAIISGSIAFAEAFNLSLAIPSLS
jgi:hypothetical protein